MMPSEPPPPPSVRVNDAERNATVEVLRHHTTAGFLTLDEFAERVGVALTARTRGDLDAVTADLPVAPPQGRDVEVPRRRRASRWLVAIFGGSERKGRWRPNTHTAAIAVFGGCEIDLRAAEVDVPELVITAVAIFGGIDIIVPEGIEVDLSGLAIFGGKDCSVADVPIVPGSPVVRVDAFALFGGVSVKNKTEKEEKLGRHHHRKEHRHVHPREVEARAGRLEDAADDILTDARAPQFDGTVTILFSDIEDFTGMTERLGDLAAQEVLRAHFEIVRGQIAAHGGHEVKCQGDSFMVAFDGARRALRCAVAIQLAMDDYADKHPDEPIRVRMGVHTGEAIREDDDLFGKTVIVAARIAAQARGGEILVSSLLRELTDSSGEFHFGPPREAVLKGIAVPHRLYAVAF